MNIRVKAHRFTDVLDVIVCPICKGNQFSTNWQGRINILDANKSEIAKKIGVTVKGEYVLKVR